MQNRLLIFKPAIVSRRDSLFLTAAERKHPIALNPQAYTETVRVKLPEGFAVDEVPNALKIDEPFGSYSASHEVRGSELIFTRSLTIRRATLPAAQYAAVRAFYQKILDVEQAPAVLIRKVTAQIGRAHV